MGRTLETATQLIQTEEHTLSAFRRALRRQDQIAFDELFINARKHVAAITMAADALPYEIILLAMLLEEHSEVRRLREEVRRLSDRLGQFCDAGD